MAPILTKDAACLTFYSRTLCDIQLYYRCLSFCFLKQHRIFRNSRVGRWKTRELKTISGPPIDSTRLTHNITSEVNEGRNGGREERGAVRDELRGRNTSNIYVNWTCCCCRCWRMHPPGKLTQTRPSNYTRFPDIYFPFFDIVILCLME